MQIGKFGFERDERMIGAGNIAGAAGAGAMPRRSSCIAAITSGWLPMQR